MNYRSLQERMRRTGWSFVLLYLCVVFELFLINILPLSWFTFIMTTILVITGIVVAIFACKAFDAADRLNNVYVITQ